MVMGLLTSGLVGKVRGRENVVGEVAGACEEGRSYLGREGPTGI